MSKLKIFVALFVVLTLVVTFSVLSGCQAPAEETTAAAEETTAAAEETTAAAEETTAAEAPAVETVIDELEVGMLNPPDTIDPFKMTSGEGYYMMQLVYNGLTEADKNFGIVPALAEDWDISEDGLEYTFYLKQGVKFHNGREFTADDAKFTLDAYMDPDVAYAFSSDFDAVNSVEVIDEYTIKVTLDYPFSPFLAVLGTGANSPMLAKESFTENEDGSLSLDEVIGTGPYKFVEMSIDEYVTLEANEDYWAGAPNVKKINFRFVPDNAVRLASLKAGDLDIIKAPAENDLISYIENPTPEEGYVLDFNPASQSLVYLITLNQFKEDSPFQDARVRKAVDLGIDKEALTQIVTKGIGHVSGSMYPLGSVWEAKVMPPERDVEEAKRLLAEAGYPDGLEVTFLSSPIINFEKQAEVIQAQLAEIGMTVNIELVEAGQWFNAIHDLGENPDSEYDMCNAAHTFTADCIMHYNFWLKCGSAVQWWVGNYCNPEIDELIDLGGETTDVAAKQEIQQQILEIIKEDSGIIWLYSSPDTYGYRTDLQGVEFNTRGDFIFENNKGIPWITRVATE